MEQYADTADPFVNLIYKKLRNKNKKLDKINQTRQKISQGIAVNKEQLDMLNNEEPLTSEMKDLKSMLKMYEKAYPDNPLWSKKGAKKGKQA